MHSKEAIETMDMPRRCCISFEQMQDNICILFTLILIPMQDFFMEKTSFVLTYKLILWHKVINSNQVIKEITLKNKTSEVT